MAKFKVGDHIKRDPSNGVRTWISGEIVGYHKNFYKIFVNSCGDVREITIDFIDRSWVMDEDKTVDLILRKYSNAQV